ncbi:transporter substrate-binding domain-containing protein [Bengtsoniella intestinalis]|uniref:substrate-binding periplasmic protein n=1 Tax=Bengtsoniella intestinalis TaxID=3073143 RepID=UPI00391F0E1D
MKQRLKQLHMLVIAVAVVLGCFVMNVAAADTEPTVIRVGYMLNYGTVKSPIIKGAEGYGYEYLTEIFKYTKEDYQLEFVYCEWEEGKAMLQSGELDILGPTTYSEAGAELYGYPDSSFGDNMIFLSTLSGQSVTYADYNNINGQKIAVQVNNPNEYMLHDFLDEYGLDAEIVYFTDNNYESALENLGCDLCLASSLQTVTDLVPVATLGILDFYYVTNYGNEALIEELNYAMERLKKSEFMFQEQLYLTYYNYTISNVHYISAEDFAILQSQELYTVGVENLYSPVAYKNEQGELAGVALDVVEMMAEIAGINYEIIEVDSTTSEEVLQSMDFAFLSITGVDNENLIDSTPYCTLPFMLIDRTMDGETIDNIGILAYYGITEVEVEDHIYGREIFEYDNIIQMQEAYNQGEIDSFIITSSTLNIIRDAFEDLSFQSSSLGADLNLTAIFPPA